MKEQVSALMDGELGSGAECDGCVKRLKIEPELRATWDIYHLIGDTLRGQGSGSLPIAFGERLAIEPTVLAPKRRAMQKHPAWFALSAAASVAAVVYVGWMALPMLTGQPQIGATVATTAPQTTPIAAAGPVAPPATTLSNVMPASADMYDYFMAHQRFSSTSAMAGVAPYARTVSTPIEKR